MKILHINSSPRGEASFSIQLANAIISELKSSNPGSSLTVHDLTKTPFPHLEEFHLTSFFTAPETRTKEQTMAIAHSDAAIAEIFESDVLVVSVPMYNFGIHSTLKAWIDHVARAGITFRYSEAGPVGMIENKKVYLSIATGGIYSDGPYKSFDYTEPYLRTIFGFLGLTEVTTFRVEGLALDGIKDTALAKAISEMTHSLREVQVLKQH